jgi:cytidyltransferase-like protein
MTNKVFVSGCFDLLHSGHIAFLQQAAVYGQLYVAIGSDRTIYDLKGRTPLTTEQERLFMVQSLACVTQAFISRGSNILDFRDELIDIHPHLFIVNEDGNIPAKQQLCATLGIDYLVLKREPHRSLPARSTTALRRLDQLPYRLDLAGGWLDQPFVSRHATGPVVIISIEPTVEFNERSGMASSTRRSAQNLWGPVIPIEKYEKLARILFCYDNPPGTTEVSGSQDAIGIVFPGLTKACYEGDYWPTSIDNVQDETVLQFIEQHLYLLPLGPRHSTYNPLQTTLISANPAQALASAAEACWHSIQQRDVRQFGATMTAAFDAQVTMFPHMASDTIHQVIDDYRDRVTGWKIAGAGGGGYLIFVASQPLSGAMQIKIRRAGM